MPSSCAKNSGRWPEGGSPIRFARGVLAAAVGLGLVGCMPQAAPPAQPTNPGQSAVRAVSPTASASPSSIPSLTASPAVTETQPASPQVCSPLEGVDLKEIPGRISNPYNPPPPGSDNPHEGIDLADLLPGTRAAVPGLGVRAVLDGVVAVVLADRFPYGNAVFIETHLEALPPVWVEKLALPTPGPTLAPGSTALTCPVLPGPLPWEGDGRSLYLVYAHLKDTPQVQPGDPVSCGQPLGAIGDTGNALNPHLHLEARVGASGARFASLAHYDASASVEEMANYCLWRISGWFQLIDPLTVLLGDDRSEVR